MGDGDVRASVAEAVGKGMASPVEEDIDVARPSMRLKRRVSWHYTSGEAEAPYQAQAQFIELLRSPPGPSLH